MSLATTKPVSTIKEELCIAETRDLILSFDDITIEEMNNLKSNSLQKTWNDAVENLTLKGPLTALFLKRQIDQYNLNIPQDSEKFKLMLEDSYDAARIVLERSKGCKKEFTGAELYA